MEQRCNLLMVWLTWLGLPAIAILIGLRAGLVAGVTILVLGVVGQLLYLRWFPRISHAMGYGSVADSPAPEMPPGGHLPAVTLYTASVCPFCPILRRRLAELQRKTFFEV